MNHTINLHSNNNPWPKEVRVITKSDNGGKEEELKTLHSREEMNQLLEEVILFNSENEDKQRIISL